MVLLEDGHCLRDQAIAFCAPNRRGNIKELLLAVNDDKRLKPLVTYRRLAGKTAARSVVLVCRDRFPRKREVELLANFIRTHLLRGAVEKAARP
jgi:hypothetical protein